MLILRDQPTVPNPKKKEILGSLYKYLALDPRHTRMVSNIFWTLMLEIIKLWTEEWEILMLKSY